MTSIKFIVYSDIHYDRLGARCVTLEDCEAVETAVHKRAVEGGFDFTLFCGDRFLKREPEDEVKTRADSVLFRALELGSKQFHLIGNHDWVSKSMRWHTSQSLKAYRPDCPICLLYKPETSIFRDLHTGDITAIHALPAGFAMDMNLYTIDPSVLNIFVFHDMVQGCKLDDAGKVIAGTGIRLADIDRPEFDVVFGGDIHVPQKLPFRHTIGGYVGAVMQRTRADANQERGWLEVLATKDGNKWNVEMEFSPVRQFFTHTIFDIGSAIRFEDLKLDEVQIKDTAVEVELCGEKCDVDRIAGDRRWQNYIDYYNVRSLEVLRRYKSVQKEAVVDMSMSSSVAEDLKTYLDSGFVDTGTIPKQKLTETLEGLL